MMAVPVHSLLHRRVDPAPAWAS